MAVSADDLPPCWKCGEPAEFYTSKLGSEEPCRYEATGTWGDSEPDGMVPASWCGYHFPRIWFPARVSKVC